MKQTLRGLGYEVDDGKTLSGIVKDVYDAFQEDKKNSIANEVMSSYLHFANLLEDLGINPEELVDENGNLDTSKFDKDVSAIVKGALNNANHLKQIQDKIDASFKALSSANLSIAFSSVSKSLEEYTVPSAFLIPVTANALSIDFATEFLSCSYFSLYAFSMSVIASA